MDVKPPKSLIDRWNPTRHHPPNLRTVHCVHLKAWHWGNQTERLDVARVHLCRATGSSLDSPPCKLAIVCPLEL